MTNVSEEFRPRRGAKAPGRASEPAPDRRPSPASDRLSPQDFYAEMVARPDVRSILTRLAQIEYSSR